MTETISSRVIHLEMLARPEYEAIPSADGVAVRREVRPTVERYRFLYDAVGSQWNWADRKIMRDEELGEILADDRVEVYVVQVDGTTAGYGELDRRVDGQIELAYFGLIPEFVGKGLGRFFLQWIVEKAWSYGPRRVWVHTCDLDHPAALPLYRKMGFEPFHEEVVDQVLL